uniref:Uncharacterized protein n=1 Tax=Aureoumbra lagunensis TaxID=44058 RepID=A0A7S3NLX4_9STRA|mmetsp:Transcript_18714/g.28216  ORF Transcript_18714/g.28216 Transcript_18714/m.28216 type:complete len:276 (+) Transcript_18714:61-888(+)
MDVRASQTQIAFELSDTEASRKAHEILPAEWEWEEDGHLCGQQQICENERLEAAMAGVCLTLILGTILNESGLELQQSGRILGTVGVAGGFIYGIRKLGFERWYNRHYSRELARERWELENYKKGEQEEMTGLFAYKGMSRKDAEAVVQTMSTYQDFFVNIMMTEELGLREPISRLELRVAAVAAAFSFAAILPLIATNFFIHFFSSNLCYSDDRIICPQNMHNRLIIAFGTLTIALLGARRAFMSKLPIFIHTLEAMLIAFLCVIIPKILLIFS